MLMCAGQGAACLHATPRRVEAGAALFSLQKCQHNFPSHLHFFLFTSGFDRVSNGILFSSRSQFVQACRPPFCKI